MAALGGGLVALVLGIIGIVWGGFWTLYVGFFVFIGIFAAAAS